MLNAVSYRSAPLSRTACGASPARRFRTPPETTEGAADHHDPLRLESIELGRRRGGKPCAGRQQHGAAELRRGRTRGERVGEVRARGDVRHGSAGGERPRDRLAAVA